MATGQNEASSTEALHAIDEASYINLATFKRDGSKVATPVWFAGQHGDYYVFSAGNAGKVKRLRNSDKADIAPCTATGKITGSSISGRATLLTSADEIKAAHKALLNKYGWQMRLLDIGSALSGKINKRAFIRVTTHSA